MNEILNENDDISVRKNEHIHIVLENDVDAKITTWLECVILIHKALPEIDFNTINTHVEAFGRRFNAPILIEGMTGGTELASIINKNLAMVAEEFNIPMGLGSQRIALKHPNTAWSFKIARETAPNAFLIANIGAPQLRELSLTDIDSIVSMIEANALAIHLNPLQEVVQPEGDKNYQGIIDKIAEISDALKIPIIAKETGAGISREVARMLIQAGVKAIDVAGAGGTSWAAVEYYRAKRRGDELSEQLGKTFWNWGIPTAASILEVKNAILGHEVYLIGSGGIRNGLDVGKAIVLGADLVGMAQPFLLPAIKGVKELKHFLTTILLELKTTMFLTGSRNINEFKNTEYFIMPPLKYWVDERKLKI